MIPCYSAYCEEGTYAFHVLFLRDYVVCPDRVESSAGPLQLWDVVLRLEVRSLSEVQLQTHQARLYVLKDQPLSRGALVRSSLFEQRIEQGVNEGEENLYFGEEVAVVQHVYLYAPIVMNTVVGLVVGRLAGEGEGARNEAAGAALDAADAEEGGFADWADVLYRAPAREALLAAKRSVSIVPEKVAAAAQVDLCPHLHLLQAH